MKDKTLAFFGDFFIKDSLKRHPLDDSDINIVNLEAPVTDSVKRHPGKVNLRMNKHNVQEMFRDRDVVFTLGNNHIMDCTEEGYLDTVDFLRKNNVSFLGAGSLDTYCNNPLLVSTGKKSVAIINIVSRFTSPVFADGRKPGVLDISYIDEVLSVAKQKKADRIIAIIHWGAEEVSVPTHYDVKFAHRLIDKGVDLIIGHHAHCKQSIEKYKDKYIFYGLGNFAFAPLNEPSYYNDNGESTKIYKKAGHAWNFESYKVRYSAETGALDLYELHFNGKNEVSEKKVSLKQHTSYLPKIGYQHLFKVFFIQSKLRVFYYNFKKNPKLPNVKHLKSLVNVFFKKEFK